MGQKKSKTMVLEAEYEPSSSASTSSKSDLARGEKAKVAGTGLGPGWGKLSYAEQKSFLEKWRVLADGRSSMSTAEFLDLLVNGSGMDRELATMVVKAYDLDGDGVIDLDEFKTFAALGLKGSDQDKLRASFHIFDTNNDGSLSRDELKLKIRAVLKGKRMAHNFSAMYSKILDKETDQVVDKIFDLIDTDKNGTIDVEEFVTGFAENAEVSELLRDIAYSMSDL